jgi:predicted methyltransferase
MMRAAVLGLMLAGAASAQPPHEKTEPCAQCFVDDLEARNKATNAALDAPDRPMEHRLRDEGRRIHAIVDATARLWTDNGLQGKRVLDIGAGGGYLSLVFSSLVGESGHLDIHNTPGWIAQFPGMDPERQRAWIRRPNIGWIMESWNNLDAPAESYDIVLMGQVYHDVILEGGDFEELNRRLFRMLKPGGLVVIEDHDADAAMPLGRQAGLHRIAHEEAKAHFLAAGFREVDTQLFDSRYDDRRMNVFWPTARGRTDRFISVFVKAAE